MYNQEKIKRLAILGLVLLLGIVFTLGYGIGSIGKDTANKPKIKETTGLFETKPSEELTQKKVEDFLKVYFTKKELGENQNRYKPFMTESMFRQELSQEEAPENSTYQGYVIDYKYAKSTIYIDEKNKKSLVTVDYTNTLLAEKGNEEGAQKNILNTANYLITYASTPTGKLLISQIEPLLVQDQNGMLNKSVTLP